MTLHQAGVAMALAHVDYMDNQGSRHFWNLFVEARNTYRRIRDGIDLDQD